MDLSSALNSINSLLTGGSGGASRADDGGFAGQLAQAATGASSGSAQAGGSGSGGALLPGGLVPVPSFPRSDSGPRLFDAVTPASLPETTFYSENAVPMNSVVVNTEANDVTKPKYIAQAALKVNPSADIVVPTRAKFESADDPKFKEERSRIAKELGVPEANVVPVRSDSPSWPQDDFMAGRYGLVKPLERESIDGRQRTQFGTNELASELGLPTAMSPTIARGGDTHVVSRPDGEQFAYFSEETLAYTANTHGFDIQNQKDRLRAIGITMKSMNEAGVPMDNIMPIGRSAPELADAKTAGEVIDRLKGSEGDDIQNKIRSYFNKNGYPEGSADMTIGQEFDTLPPEAKAQILGPDHEKDLFAKRDEAKRSGVRNDTYGAVMAQMSPEELKKLDPEVREQLKEMKDLPFPQYAYDYHTDVMSFTPDGKTMFVRESDADDPQLQKQLKFFGFDPVALPSASVISPERAEEMKAKGQSLEGYSINDEMDPKSGPVTLNYSNMVQGRTPDGKPAILMPTEALDPEKLTANDREALETIRKAVPDAVVVPIGGRSALKGRGDFEDGGSIEKDYGTHCLSNVLPYDIVPRQ